LNLIIDNLYYKLYIKNPNEYKISIDTLELFNKKRTQAINHFKELSKKTLQYIHHLIIQVQLNNKKNNFFFYLTLELNKKI